MSVIVRRVNWGNLDVPSCQVLCSVSAWCRLYDLKAVVVGDRERDMWSLHFNSATDQMHKDAKRVASSRDCLAL